MSQIFLLRSEHLSGKDVRFSSHILELESFKFHFIFSTSHLKLIRFHFFFSAAGLFAAVYLATFLISNVVTNNAAAALIFPVAINAAEQTETDVTLMSYCVMLGASASFMSPFGYTYVGFSE